MRSSLVLVLTLVSWVIANPAPAAQTNMGDKIVDHMTELPKCYFDCCKENKGSFPGDLFTETILDFCNKNYQANLSWIRKAVTACLYVKCGNPKEVEKKGEKWRKHYCKR